LSSLSPPAHTLAERVRADFDQHARLSASFPGYVHRAEQVRLAEEIAESVQAGHILLAEAETGIGKTLAYLVPALRSEDRILISTHTRALQDQLMHRDIPAVMRALDARRHVALLKGRSNYLCPFRLKRHVALPRMEPALKRWLGQVMDWAHKTRDGDLAGLPFEVFEVGIGGMVTATAEQCGGSRCPDWHECPLMKARARAQEAEIVVSNHSLLLADAALKAGEFGEVLPAFDAYVIDEAHSLPALACQHFGAQVSRLRLIQWLNDMQAELDVLGDEATLKAEVLRHGRVLIDTWSHQSAEVLSQHWQPLLELARGRAERSEEMGRLHERAGLIADDLEAVAAPPAGYVAWTEGEGEAKRHVLAPVETGPVLSTHLWERQASFTLLSATLRVSGSFAFAQQRLGVPEAVTRHHPSPFDYRRQALIYIPRHLPDTRSPEGSERLLAEIVTLLQASRGRAFVLFTSYQMLRRIAPALEARLPWTVLTQGLSGSRDSILESFREDTHSVLCGTRSFWEGVDVPGETLSLVVIDKIPFAPPNDPLLAARIRRCEEHGGNGFRDIQMPEAIAVLRQGVGRLIRKQEDHGVIAILDSRIYGKFYGREIVRNLPAAPVTADISDVQAFFDA
jgi:ATP-dependent DNA helicase DinG